MSNLILASSSPRRKELLAKLQVPFTTLSTDTDETISHALSPDQIVTELAIRKARQAQLSGSDAFIIGADTIVVSNGKVLGKPADRREAKSTLQALSGRTHEVFTGVAILKGPEENVFFEKTKVSFWELDEALIERYLDSGEPFDKAGAYGIQGYGSVFVKSIEGDYFSVVGLPVSRLFRQLTESGFEFPASSK